jgi:hypothetical protein
MANKLGNDGHFSVEWSSVQKPQTEMLSNGHSLEECFLLHLGQYMLIAAFSSSCFFLILRVSNWEPIVLKISVLKFSKRFPISSLVIPPELTGFKLLL